jgi:hypothetical protein
MYGLAAVWISVALVLLGVPLLLALVGLGVVMASVHPPPPYFWFLSTIKLSISLLFVCCYAWSAYQASRILYKPYS